MLGGLPPGDLHQPGNRLFLLEPQCIPFHGANRKPLPLKVLSTRYPEEL